jgi:hypothetical protein
MLTDLQKLAAACNAAAELYCARPELTGPATVIDIYRTMAVLATMIDMQREHATDERMH